MGLGGPTGSGEDLEGTGDVERLDAGEGDDDDGPALHGSMVDPFPHGVNDTYPHIFGHGVDPGATLVVVECGLTTPLPTGAGGGGCAAPVGTVDA